MRARAAIESGQNLIGKKIAFTERPTCSIAEACSPGYGQDEMTSHGFRASASTLLNESGKWSADAVERQLAHVENNNVRRAYARGEH